MGCVCEILEMAGPESDLQVYRNLNHTGEVMELGWHCTRHDEVEAPAEVERLPGRAPEKPCESVDESRRKERAIPPLNVPDPEHEEPEMLLWNVLGLKHVELAIERAAGLVVPRVVVERAIWVCCSGRSMLHYPVSLAESPLFSSRRKAGAWTCWCWTSHFQPRFELPDVEVAP